MELEFAETGLPCPCGYHENAFARNKDGSGKCFSQHCGQKFFFPKKFWDHLRDCTPEPYADRGVPRWVGEKFGALQYRDPHGNIAFYEFKYPNQPRSKITRVLDKHSEWSGEKGTPIPSLYGVGFYDAGTSRNAIVVEGEKDFLAAYYMLNDKMKTETHVYALPSAGVPRKQKQEIFDVLNKYDRVIVASENDEAGTKTREVFASMFGSKMRSVDLTKHKDANDYLKAGDIAEFKRAVTNYSRFTPEFIFSGMNQLTKLWEEKEADYYVPTPFSKLNELIKGIPLGHVVLLAGPEGTGKSEILRAIEWEVINKVIEEGYAVSVTHFEESNKDMLKGFGCYDQSVNFRDPDKKYTLSDIEPTLEKLKEEFYITDFYKARDEMSVQTFMEKVRYLHDVCGVRFFFVDPINQLRPDNADETLEKFLTGLALEFERFAVDNHCAVVWTAHVNDDGQTRDSRMIAKAASIRININRSEEDGKTYLTVDKNRPFSRRGPAGHVEFDTRTFTLSDPFVGVSAEPTRDERPRWGTLDSELRVGRLAEDRLKPIPSDGSHPKSFGF